LTCKVKELPANASKDYGGIISSKTIKKAIPSAIYGNRSYDAVMLVVPTNAVDNLVSGVSNDISDIVSGAGGMW